MKYYSVSKTWSYFAWYDALYLIFFHAIYSPWLFIQICINLPCRIANKIPIGLVSESRPCDLLSVSLEIYFVLLPIPKFLFVWRSHQNISCFYLNVPVIYQTTRTIWGYCGKWFTQRTHDVIITSLLRQNDVAMSFWRNDDVIITSCACRAREHAKI